MKIKTIMIMALVIGMVVLAGCSSGQQRSDQYSNIYGNPGGNVPPPQAGAGCGVVMPADSHDVPVGASLAL